MEETESFLRALQQAATTFNAAVATSDGEWIVKGFIDVYKRIYTISVDTKVVSKVLELLLLPEFIQFGEEHGYDVILTAQQNFYPDVSFVSRRSGTKYAVDIKTTYRLNDTTVNGMTLGAFTGYFRLRTSNKNTTFPYGAYAGHYVLGVIYTKGEVAADAERRTYTLDDLETIQSVARNFTFFAQPKWKIASARPGSGNTKNVGSVTLIEQLLQGSGPFAELGETVYDDYWTSYLTRDMAAILEMPRPYTDLKSYIEYKNRAPVIAPEQAQALDAIDTGPGIPDSAPDDGEGEESL